MRPLPLKEVYPRLTLDITSGNGETIKNVVTMIDLFWNCRGVSKKGMSVIVKDILADNVVDFVGLQETMKKTYSDAFF